MDKKIKVILLGAGMRGQVYTDVMHELPGQYEVVAVAEPEATRMEHVKKLHGLDASMCFEDYNDLLALGKIADLAIIGTQDKMHFDPAMKAIELGYDLLLEKPISTSAAECAQIAAAADRKGVKVIVCTVLRYTPLFSTIKKLIDEGRIGRIISINHEENVGNVHQSHSFVRGNWGNEGRSSFMLLAKSCHDMDLLAWLVGSKCTAVQSFGSLTHFTRANMPEGAPERCIDGCPHGEKCPYNSVKLYLDDKDNLWFRTASTMKHDPTDEDVLNALRTTQYGKCVYRCDNDVVDHQTVNMVFEGGATVTFTMNAFNKGGRFTHIMGTKGELRAEFTEDSRIELYDFETKKTEEIPLCGSEGLPSGHGGGDEGIVTALYRYLALGDSTTAVPEIAESCRNHLMTFAAEQSRLENRIVSIDQYIKDLTGQGEK